MSKVEGGTTAVVDKPQRIDHKNENNVQKSERESVKFRLALKRTIEDLNFLPVVKQEKPIRDKLEDPDVRMLLVVGPPGSGKSLGLVPLIADDLARVDGSGRTVVVEPRRDIVREAGGPGRDPEKPTLQDRIGREHVDHAFKGHHPTGEPEILFTVPQSLLIEVGECLKTKKKFPYKRVVLDEAHLNTRVLKPLLAMLMQQESDVKAILATGTADAVKEDFRREYADLGYAEVEVAVEQKESNLAYKFHEGVTFDNLTQKAAELAAQIVRETPKDENIIIFMPSQATITDTENRLKELLKDEDIAYLQAIGKSENIRERMLQNANKRNIVISTSKLREGVNLPKTNFSIVPEFELTKLVDPLTGVEQIVPVQKTKGSAIQEAKRAGREEDAKGKRKEAHFLFAEDLLTKSESEGGLPDREFTNQDPTADILLLKAIGIDDVRNFPYEGGMKLEYIEAGIKRLQQWGALDKNEQTTQLGQEMFEWRTEPRFARMLVGAERTKDAQALAGVTALVGLMSTQESLFDFKFKPNESFADKFSKYAKPESEKFNPPNIKSDFIVLLRIWNDYLKGEKIEGINAKAFATAAKVARELSGEKELTAVTWTDETVKNIQGAIAGGLGDKVLRRNEGNRFDTYKQEGVGPWSIHVSKNSLFSSEYPEKILSASLTHQSKNNMTFASFNQTFDQEMMDKVAPYLKAFEEEEVPREEFEERIIPPDEGQNENQEQETVASTVSTAPVVTTETVSSVSTRAESQPRTPKKQPGFFARVKQEVRDFFRMLREWRKERIERRKRRR